MKLSNYKKYAGPVILQRAKKYLAEGKVDLQETADGEYDYKVFGTDTYDVHISLDGEEIKQHSCTCPYKSTYGSLCKHETACLLDIENSTSVNQSDKSSKPKPAEEPDDILEFGLPARKLYYLSYLAFTGLKPNTMAEKVPETVHPTWRFPQYRQKEMTRELRKEGWIPQHDPFDYYQETPHVSPEHILKILKNLILNHEIWLASFRYYNQSSISRYLYQVAFALSSGQTLNTTKATQSSTPPVAPVTRSYSNVGTYINRSLLPAFLSEDPAILKTAISEATTFNLAANVLTHVLEKGDPSHMDRIAEIIGTYDYPSSKRTALQCLYRMTYFYATGSLSQAKDSWYNYHHTYYSDAVNALFEGRTDDSIDLFQKGLRLQNKLYDFKNIPCDSISFFFYVVALLKRRSAKDTSALRIIAGKSRDIKFNCFRAIFPLAAFGQDSQQYMDTFSLCSVIDRDQASPNSSQRVIATLILHFFGMQDQRENAALPTPELAVLQKECSAWWGTDPGPIPHPAVLHSIKVRQPWELDLEEMINSLGKPKQTPEKKATANSERLIYLANCYSDELEVREQSRLKSGAWSKGKKLSMVRYKAADCPMDDIDRRIHEQWLLGDPAFPHYPATTWFPSLPLALPHLVRSDKLWHESTGMPVTIKEEKPYLIAEKTTNGIIFSSNIPDEARLNKDFYHSWKGSKELTYFPCPKAANLILDRLLEMKRVPLEAEPMLEQLFTSLNGALEIHSDISGASDIHQVKGNTKIIARIHPAVTNQGVRPLDYPLQVLVRPLEGGRMMMEPGRGEATYYDENEEGRQKVCRDIAGEKRNLRRLNTLLSEQLDADGITAGTPSTMLSTEQLLALLSAAPEHNDYLEIEWPEGEKPIVFKPDTTNWEINAKGHGGWFELEGELRISEDMVVSVARLLELARQGGSRFVRLSENEFLELSDSLRKQLARIDAVAQETRGKVKVPGLALAVAGDSLDGDIGIKKPDSLLQMRRRIKESTAASFPVPDSLNATLRYYQEEGYRWMMRLGSWGAGACLADDMGLGKTVQAIAFLLAHAAEGPSLVIAPASVVSNWERELHRFAPSLRVCILNSQTAPSREEAIARLSAGSVLITTYGLLISELEPLTSQKWTTACLDEAHTIKNRNTKSSTAAMKLDANYRIILTGTPVQNHLGELWNLFQFVNPGLLGSYEHFSERFLSSDSPSSKEDLKRIVSPFILRRTKSEVIQELPDKEEIILPVPLSDIETAEYEVIRREAKAELETASTVNVGALSMITKLRMKACGESKLEALIEKLPPIVEGGNSVLVFSQFTSFLARVKQKMEEVGLTDYLYLDGQTPVAKRQMLVDCFQRGEKKIFLISLKAGGLGLNLTGANYVIHLDPWWNPAIEQQATDRAYRIGQTQKVTVYHLIASQTIEEKILRLHGTKRDLADTILEGANISSRLTPSELLEMLGD